MKENLSSKFEEGRIREGYYASDKSYGCMGAFIVQGPCGEKLRIVSSGGQNGWEHVSVSIERRIPNWQEMCFVKEAFWNDDECVMQLHPPKSDYINLHPNCLHLWCPMDELIPMPPNLMV
jgi:hypothetical protein